MATTGDLCEVHGEITVEWSVKDFFPLSKGFNKSYDSPYFYFSGNSFQISLRKDGLNKQEKAGWVDVIIYQQSTGHSVDLELSINIKSSDGKELIVGRKIGREWSKILTVEDLTKKKSELSASNDIIVTCTMKNSKPIPVTGSLFSRQQEVCDNLKNIYVTANGSDLKLKVEGEDIFAHRIILETRSPVFSAMLNRDTKKKKISEVSIDDMEKTAMKFVLEYLYCGDIERLTKQNAVSIYSAAVKYDVKFIREICLTFIKENLSVECVCDVIEFADSHSLDELGSSARDYFKQNACKILDTERWKTFSKENPDTCVALLGHVTKAHFAE